ncbi:hypothetical protein CSV72_01335 [Sporosarcina sp. P20a]|uniref:DUF3169 family protein n=1 Tax=Sporosarcina sp. P20a TaxID=2048256 RepID=UPI000C16A043|nr:DUF3169 family protein [Sporosarcina sp. P20a]PIC87823.1 hypothetical protein CSV72_01335 [Sporosarcina sp. P20a]
MRMIIWTLIGAVVGFFGMYAALSIDFKAGFPPVALEVNIVLVAITLLLFVFIAVSATQMKKKADLTLTGVDEDERDVWQYKRFSDLNLCNTVALIVSIVATGISIITDQPTWLLMTSGGTLVLSIMFSMRVPGLMKTVYPDRELPSSSEKNFANKLLAASDEGERFVMLQGYYKTFNTMNLSLIIALMLFILYSVGTGDSQLFSIFIVGLILILTNAQYLLTIRNK